MKRTRRVVAAAPESDASEDEVPESLTVSQAKQLSKEARRAEEEGKKALEDKERERQQKRAEKRQKHQADAARKAAERELEKGMQLKETSSQDENESSEALPQDLLASVQRARESGAIAKLDRLPSSKKTIFVEKDNRLSRKRDKKAHQPSELVSGNLHVTRVELAGTSSVSTVPESAKNFAERLRKGDPGARRVKSSTYLIGRRVAAPSLAYGKVSSK